MSQRLGGATNLFCAAIPPIQSWKGLIASCNCWGEGAPLLANIPVNN